MGRSDSLSGSSRIFDCGLRPSHKHHHLADSDVAGCQYNVRRTPSPPSRPNFHDAEDLTQTTFVEALNTIERLRDPTRLGAWLGTIKRRLHEARKPA